MATPRKRYFRVADSILFENWDDNQLATMVRLCAYLNVRWAREGRHADEACEADLCIADLFKITRKNRVDVARKSLQRLADVTSMSAERCGDVTRVRWRKFVEYQEFASLSASASAASPASATKEKTRAPSAPVADATPRAPRRELVEKPENFPDDSRERLKAWGDSKGFNRELLNAGLERFREWEPQKPPYRRTFKQWEGSFKKIVREGVAVGMIGKPEGKAKPVYRRDDSGQVLVPNEWRGLAG